MPIDDDAVGIVKWGTGAGASNFNTPADVGFAEADGWPLAYGTPGSGSEPQREVFNWQWRRLTALAVELLTHGGGLPWDSRISYLHPASVMGSDGMLYQSVQGSLNQDPTTDTSDTDWQQVGITLSDTDIKTAYERNADTNALTDALLTRLQGAAPLASPSFSGAVTVPDQTAGTNNARAANTRFVAAALAALLVSPAFTNDPTAPTQTAGNDSTRLATTAFVQAALAALVASAPGHAGHAERIGRRPGRRPELCYHRYKPDCRPRDPHRSDRRLWRGSRTVWLSALRRPGGIASHLLGVVRGDRHQPGATATVQPHSTSPTCGVVCWLELDGQVAPRLGAALNAVGDTGGSATHTLTVPTKFRHTRIILKGTWRDTHKWRPAIVGQ